MATKSWWIHQVILMLLFLSWGDNMHCSGLTVDPPKDLVILDPGHLGELDITWKPPPSLINMTECSTLYQLEYFNTYRNGWTAIRTSRNSYTAQFDLMKDIRVRVYTLLSGPCTNGSMIKSTNYIELVQKPPSAGIVDTAVQDFLCLFHNMDYMECTWRRSSKMPANSQHTLYIWHKELAQAVECPKYIISDGVRTGCNFAGKILPDFINIIFCINGSSDEGPLKPKFTSLQIQNQVKPGTTEKLHLQTGPDRQLEIQWEHPVGRIPGLCLEWEVEHNEEGPDGKVTSKQFFTRQTNLTLPSIHDNWRNCFRVRSKVNKYCAAKGFWSEWSRPGCHTEVTAEAEWDMVPAYLYITTAIIAILVLSLCVWAMVKVRGSRQDKKPDSLLTSLFARNSVLTVADA